MSTIIDGEINSTPPSTAATTASPQRQSQNDCDSEQHAVPGNVERSDDADLHRWATPTSMVGVRFFQSTKIRLVLSMLVMAGALIHARFLPQSIYDRFIPTSTPPMNNSNGDEAAGKTSLPSSPFMIIIDGGSTGSRLHIFEFVLIYENNIENDKNGANSAQLSTATIIERRGSFRTISPLSTFISTNYEHITKNEDDGHHLVDGYYFVNHTELKVNHVVPLLQYIEQNIPKRFIHTTPIYYAATAGMRLLTESQQQLIYDTVIQIVADYCREHDHIRTGNIENRDCFYFPRHHIQTLSGELEGYYGVLAANYLHGKIDVNLHIVHKSNNENGADAGDGKTQATSATDTVANPELTMDETARIETASGSWSKSITGALDMGGSSTQIVFYTADNQFDIDMERELCSNTNHDGTKTLPRMRKKKQLNERHFFSMSYLSYGVDQFRDRLWNLLAYDYEKSERSVQEETSSVNIVVNPCSNPGHNVTAIINGTMYLLAGSGNVLVCKEHMKRIIPHPIQTPIHHIYDELLLPTSARTNKVVGGIQHPSIYNESPSPQQDDMSPSRGERGTTSPDFLAMSLYFFTFDSIRIFTNDSIVNERWPKPTLLELENATSIYCAMNLVHDIYPLYDNDQQNQPHPYTRRSIVQHRCMEAIYMISLLETFGFTSHERHITFAFDVNGSEVEWTLGMALQYYSNNNNNTDHDQRTGTCAWDSDDRLTFTDRDAGKIKGNSSLPMSIVQRIRNYFTQISVPDATTGNSIKSIVSNP